MPWPICTTNFYPYPSDQSNKLVSKPYLPSVAFKIVDIVHQIHIRPNLSHHMQPSLDAKDHLEANGKDYEVSGDNKYRGNCKNTNLNFCLGAFSPP